MNNQDNKPTPLTEEALGKLINKFVEEALEQEAITWPSQYWSEDDVDDYRRMSQPEQQAVDKHQERLRDQENRPRIPVQGGANESLTQRKKIFAENITKRVLKSLRESINPAQQAPKPSAMARFI